MHFRLRTTLGLTCLMGSLMILPGTAIGQPAPGAGAPERPQHPEGERQRGDRRQDGARGDRGDRGAREGRGGRGFRGREVIRFMTRPDYMMSDLQVLAEILDLEEDQEPIISLIFEDYDASFTEAVDILNMSLEDIDASRPEPTEEMQAQRESMRQQMRELHGESRQLRRSMIERRRAIEDEGGNPDTDEEMKAIQVEIDDARDVMHQGFAEYRAQREVFESTDEMLELSAMNLSVLRTFADEKKALRVGLEEELMTVMIEEQLPRLPELERTLRRNKQLRQGRLAGESVNLFDLLRETRTSLNPEMESSIDDMLQSYSIDLDLSLVSRQLFDESSQLRLYESMESREYEKSLDMMKRRFQLQKNIRDVNDQYIEVMTGLLPSEQAGDFRLEALREGYPDVFRISRVTRTIDRARDIEGISPEMLEAIDSLEVAYDSESSPLLERMLLAVREHEQPRELEFLERRVNNDWSWGRRGEEEDDPVREVEGTRRELDRTYMDRLQSLLGEEEYEAIAGRGGRGEGGGNFGDFNREEVVAEFDANGDGELNEEERMALVRAMRSRFGSDRPEGGPEGGPGGRRGGGRGGPGGGPGGGRGAGGGGGGDRP